MSTHPTASPARVLMVVPQYPFPVAGGLERQAHELSRTLVAAGRDVQVLSGRTAREQPDSGSVERVTVHRIPWSDSKVVRFARAPWDILRVMWRRRASYDVVHVHQLSWFSLFAIAVARVLGKPVLAKVPGTGPYGIPGLRASALGAWKVAIVRRVDGVVAMSALSLAELRAAGFPLRQLLRTPNGIRIEDDGWVARRVPAEGFPCRVVFVGRLSAEKAVDRLLAAWQRIQREHGDATLEIWGDGPLQGELETQSRSLGIAASVRFRGHVDGVRQRLRDMDVFVLPSLTEGNSNAVLEAMAAGLPVVSTRVGGTPMQVGPAGAPLLCEPGDVDALHDRLSAVVGDARLRHGIGLAMRQRIVDCFDIRRVAATYAAAYDLLAQGRAGELPSIANPVVAD